MVVIWLGALLVVAGIVFLAAQAIWRGRLSGPAPTINETLEPPRRGLGFLGLGPNLPGFALIVVGAAMLLLGGYL